MEEEIKSVEATISPGSPGIPVQLPKKKFNLPVIVISLVVISLIAGGIYAGMQIGKKQVVGGPLPKITPTIIPQPTEIIATQTPDETANWKTYTNKDFSFTIKYPPHWGMSETGYHGSEPGSMLVWGEPANLEGLAVFSFYLFVEENLEQLSSEEYMSRIVERAGNKEGPAKISYREKREGLIGGVGVIELYGVFGGDQSEERFYLPVGDKMLVFAFPVPEENPNIFKPIENNKISHQILSTFKFTN